MTGSDSPNSSARSRSARGIAGRGDRPHRQSRSADQRGRGQALRPCQAADRQGIARWSLHRRAVSAEGSGSSRRARGRRSAPASCKDNVADHTGTLAQRFLDAGVAIFGKSSSPGIRTDADHRIPAVRPDPQSLESRALVRRFIRRRGGGGGGAHPADGACQRRRRLDPHSRLGLRRVRNEADPRAQPARPRSRRRLGRIFLRPCRQHQRARQRGHAGRDPWARSRRAPMSAPPPERPFRRRSAAIPAAAHRLHRQSPYGDAIDPEIAAAVREVAGLLAGSAIMSRSARQRLPPIRQRSWRPSSAANTALTVRLAERDSAVR